MEQSVAIQDALNAFDGPNGPEVDLLTDLPGRIEAIRSVAHSYEANSPCFVIPLAIERLGTIRLRFGEDATAPLLFLTAQMLRQKLRTADELFCWKGGVFLAVLKRQVPLELVRREVMRIAGSRIELNLNVGDRSVLVPLTLSWLLMPSAEYASPHLLTQQLHAFAAKGRD